MDKKGYQENSRETFRDETLKRWVSATIIESKAGLAANDRDSFISTYEEMERGLIPRKKKLDLNDPGIYSTSCNIDFSEAQYALNIFLRHYPKPFIAKGQTEVGCGPCQLTSERDKSKEGTHVDWWIYEKSDPQNYFKEVKENE